METISTIFVEACVACKWQLLMFIVSGIAFELLCEWAKAIIRQSTGKSTTLAVGTLLGLLSSILYIIAAYCAYKGYNGEGGWMILGTPYFLWVWFILFYFWQYTSIKIAKPIFKRLAFLTEETTPLASTLIYVPCSVGKPLTSHLTAVNVGMSGLLYVNAIAESDQADQSEYVFA